MTNKLKNIYKIFGPGILMATAAIGSSHLVSSTQFIWIFTFIYRL